jgi:hypothetical protein
VRLRPHPIPSGSRYRIAVVVQARYSRPRALVEEEAGGRLLSCGRSGKLRSGEEGQSRKTACREEQAKGPLQRRCS